MTQRKKFVFQFKLILPVKSHRKKYFPFRFPQITSISPAVPAHRGAFRDRHGRWARDAVDAAALARDGIAGRVSRERSSRAQTNGADADGEVVWS